MDKINLGSTIPAYPMPVSLVGAHVDGKPNFLAVAWFTMVSYKPPRIAIALGKGHYTNPDFKKIKPLILSQPDTSYWRLGEPLAKAWSIGKKYKTKCK